MIDEIAVLGLHHKPMEELMTHETILDPCALDISVRTNAPDMK